MMNYTLYLALAVTVSLGSIASASGTYLPPSGRAPARKGASLDSAKYALGQKTFEGKMVATGAGDMKAQKAALMAIQSKIPAGAGDVAGLAGKITNEQVEALEYYVAKRFGK